MLRGSAAFEEAVKGSHHSRIRAEAWVGSQRLGPLKASANASIAEDASQFVRRSLSLTVANTADARRMLWTPGVAVRVWYEVGSGGQWFGLPIHWGIVNAPNAPEFGGQISIDSPDIAAKVSLDRFVTPRSSSASVTVVQQITLLLRDAVPWARIEDQTGDTTPCVNGQTWATDRNQAIVDLAASIGAEVFWRPDGAFVIRYLRNLLMPADLTVRSGATLTAAARSSDATKTYNVIVAAPASTDSAAASVYAVSQDDDPASPTFVGRIGRVVGYYTSSQLTTQAQCQQAADALRLRSQGGQVALTYSRLAHPGVAAGDRHDVSLASGHYRVVCDQFTWDVFSGVFSASAKAANLPPVQGVS